MTAKDIVQDVYVLFSNVRMFCEYCTYRLHNYFSEFITHVLRVRVIYNLLMNIIAEYETNF